ncbi:MAG: T9SS type A sorting domain-containing protein [Candidatus Cloacimonetes bacterium]|nr:T9SS type A sorting domain-containing protein [Candidatus Cloacimonadota bacterium]
MKSKNKWFILFYMFFFVVALNATYIGLRIPDTTAVVGDIINIPVYADTSLTGENIYSYQLQISFETNIIFANEVIIDSTLSEPFGLPYFNNSVPGQVTIAAAGTSPLSGMGVFLYIQFEILQSGFSPVSFTGEENNFFNEGTPSIIFSNGSISIPTSVSDFQNNLTNFEIYQNYPNPFSSSTTISFNLTTDLHKLAQIKIYNIKGQLIKTLSPQIGKGAGIRKIEWNGTDNQGIQVSNGIYFYRIQYVHKPRNNEMSGINRALANDIKKLILLR